MSVFPTMVNTSSFTSICPPNDFLSSSNPIGGSSNAGSGSLLQTLKTGALTCGLKISKSYGTYSKLQQDEVISFIKEGNSLRTAEKVFGIPKSTMHCWLKKMNAMNGEGGSSSSDDNTTPTTPLTQNTKLTTTSLKPSHDRVFFPDNVKPPLIKPRAKQTHQVVIEEGELIRFLQTSEGLELIAKAYGIPVSEFHLFMNQAKKKENISKSMKKDFVKVLSAGQQRYKMQNMPNNNGKTPTKDLLNSVNSSVLKKDDYISLMKNNNAKNEALLQARKRNGVIKENTTIERKRVKKETFQRSPTILSAIRNTTGVIPKGFILTPEQLLAATKLISGMQPGNVNTYITPKPLNVTGITNEPTKSPQLSPTYPKMQNPVSIKAERPDIDGLLLKTSFNPTIEHHQSLTRPTITSNNTAKLNLNEINRTQSEKELMALVDGDNITADELCTDFSDHLELNSWVDNETWYTDQYLQHFQVSPAPEDMIMSSGADVAPLKCIKHEVVTDDDEGGIVFGSKNHTATASWSAITPPPSCSGSPTGSTHSQGNKRKLSNSASTAASPTKSAFCKPTKNPAATDGLSSAFSKS